MGTHNTVNRVFHLVGVECIYMSSLCTLEQGLLSKSGNRIMKNAGTRVQFVTQSSEIHIAGMLSTSC